MKYKDPKSTWNHGAQKAIRHGSAKEHQDHMTGAWEQIISSKQRRRVDVSYDSSTVTALQQDTWMNDKDSKRHVSGKMK